MSEKRTYSVEVTTLYTVTTYDGLDGVCNSIELLETKLDADAPFCRETQLIEVIDAAVIDG